MVELISVLLCFFFKWVSARSLSLLSVKSGVEAIGYAAEFTMFYLLQPNSSLKENTVSNPSVIL